MDICGALRARFGTHRFLRRTVRSCGTGSPFTWLSRPFYLIEDIGIAGLPMFMLAAYFLLGIELVAEDIEEPFGTGGDNLPLERYCATIDDSVRDILGTPD